MRHKINLPDQPSIVILIIVFDLFALIAVYGLYASNWVGESGQKIHLPTAAAAPLSIAKNHVILKIFPDTTQNCIVGKKMIPYEELSEELQKLQKEYALEEVLLMIDTEATIKREREVITLLHDLKLKCALVSEPRAQERPRND